MTLAVPEWLAHVFLVAVSVELVVRATLRVLKYRARRDASASGTPAPVAASVVVVNPGKTRQGRTALYWSSALALAASVILGVAYWQGDLAVFSGLGRADLMPEREWMMSTAGFRYQWVAIGKDSIDGRVPVLDCAQWAPESALALQTLLLRPIPPYSRAALDDAQRHMEEEAAHTDMRESRDKGTRRCIVSLPTLPTVSGSDYLLQRKTLDRWIPTTLEGEALAAGNATVRYVAVLRNGSRYYPIRGVVPVMAANSTQYAYAPALASEQALLQEAEGRIALQNRLTGFGLKASALDRCLCPAYYGIFGSGIQFYLDMRASKWHVWLLARVQRVVTHGCGGQGCVANQTYNQTHLSPFPYNVLQPLLDAGTASDVLYATSIVAAYYDLAAQLDDVSSDLHVNRLEPDWVDTGLAADEVGPVAAVLRLDALVPTGALETKPLDERDSLCFAHCATLDHRLCLIE